MGKGVSKRAIVVDVSYKPGAARKQDTFSRELGEPFHESSTHPLEAYLCYLVRTRPLVDHLTVSRPSTGATLTLTREALRPVCASSDYANLAEQLQELKGGEEELARGRGPKPEDRELDEEELGQAEDDEPIEDEDEEVPVNPEFEDDGWYYSDED